MWTQRIFELFLQLKEDSAEKRKSSPFMDESLSRINIKADFLTVTTLRVKQTQSLS